MSKSTSDWISTNLPAATQWNNSAFGIDLSSAKNLDPTAVIRNMGSGISSAAISGWDNTLGYLKAAGGDLTGIFSSDQYAALGDAAGSAALNYLNNKIQIIKDAWLTKKTVTVGALIGEIAPYATDPLAAGKALATKVTGILNSTSVKDVLNSAAYDFLNSSPELQSAISGLKAVQAFGNTLNSISSMVDTVKTVVNVLEPILPVVETVADFALTVWSAGTSAVKAGNNLAEMVEQLIQRLISLTFEALRKLIYNIPISLPALLLGAINTISIKEAVSSYNMNPWLSAIFSEEYYQQTLNSLNWQTSINKALNDTMGKVDDWSQFKFDNESDRGNLLKTKFLNNIVQNYMYGVDGQGGIVAKARAAAHIISFDSKTIGYGTSNGASNVVSSSTSAIINSVNGFDATTSQAAASSSESKLDKLLNNDSDESPLVDELSIRLISKKLYDTF